MQKKGDRIMIPMNKHPPKLNIIGMTSARGGTRLVTFEDNLTTRSFERYLKTLKINVGQLYRRQDCRIVMGKDPKHTSKATENYLERDTRMVNELVFIIFRP